jgi:hypothetical protein
MLGGIEEEGAKSKEGKGRTRSSEEELLGSECERAKGKMVS